MTNFNAGAIEANLTLGRSAWTRDLKKTLKEIQDLERKSITLGLDLDTYNFQTQLEWAEQLIEDMDGKEYAPSVDLITNEFDITLAEINARLDELDARTVTVSADADVANALIQLGLVEQEMDVLENDPVMIEADANIAKALAGLSILEDQMDAIEADPIQIKVHQRGIGPTTAKLAALEAQLALVNDKTINVDVDYDADQMEALVGSASGGGGGYMGLLRILIYAIIALSPVLSVAIAGASAALVGFTAALVGALGPVAVLAAGIAGLIQRFKDAKKDGEELTGPMALLDTALTHLSDAWEGFLDKIEDKGFALMAQGVELLADILPTLAPLFNATADMMSKVLDGVREFVESPEYDEMLDFFGGFGVDMLRIFIKIIGNLIVFFGRLFDAIAPFARQMMQGLRDMTAGWAEWADDLESNDSFQRWVDNALEYGPRVLDMLGSLLAAFMAIGDALLPFAGPMLDALTWFFDMIANADTDTLTIIIGALAGLWAGMNIVVPLVTALIGGISGLVSVVTFLISPIGLVVLAIAALVAILVYLWNTNEEFRTAVIDTWNAIRDTMAPIIEDIWRLIQENWGPIKDWVLAIWDDIKSIIVDAMVIIRQVVRGGAAAITWIWDNFGKQIIQYIRGAFQIIGGVIKGWFTFAKGIFQTIKAVLTGDWRGMWEGIKNILRGAWQVISSIFRGSLTAIKALWSAAWTAIKMVFGRIWDDMKSNFGTAVNWIRDKIGDLVGFFRSLPGKIRDAVSGAFDSIGSQFASAINGVINWWNGLSFSIPGFDPPGPGPKFGGFTVSTPNIGTFAKGGFVTEPTIALIGEGSDSEVVAPEPVLERIVRDNSGASFDPRELAAAIAAALAPLLSRMGVSAEDIERLIAEAGPKLSIDARSDDTAAGKLAREIGFQLRLLGFGGRQVA